MYKRIKIFAIKRIKSNAIYFKAKEERWTRPVTIWLDLRLVRLFRPPKIQCRE